MTTNKHEVLNDMIEKVLFNKAQLNELKDFINQVDSGQVSPKDVRMLILTQKEKNLEKLVELISFSLKQGKINNSHKSFSEDPPNRDILDELQEKNSFLEKVGIKVNNLVNELTKKLEV